MSAPTTPRLPDQHDLLSGVVVFLASVEASYIAVQTLDVDGYNVLP